MNNVLVQKKNDLLNPMINKGQNNLHHCDHIGRNLLYYTK